jgi:hypothetical protein
MRWCYLLLMRVTGPRAARPVLVVPAAIRNDFVIGKLAQERSWFASQRTDTKILILQ